LISQDVVDHRIARVTSIVMLGVWVIVVLEAAYHWITRPWDPSMRKFHGFSLLFCICPSLRMCARSPEMNHRLWLPGLGWRQPNHRLRKRLQRRFSIPMITIALLIMPVLVIEFFMKDQVAQHTSLRTVLHMGTGIIWFAFAFEFILMVSVAEKKLAYCKKHWIDLAIIALPIFSFMRSFQWLRATRVSKLLKLKQVTQLARVYRLRGTAVKTLRALILLDLAQRFLQRDPNRAIEKLSRRLVDVETEAKVIRRKITKLQRLRDQE
jgi:voltage-gated potassium channel